MTDRRNPWPLDWTPKLERLVRRLSVGQGGGLGGSPSLDDIIVKAPWIDVRAYASFSAAISDIGSDDKTLLISDSQTVSTNETVPSNVTLLFLQGGNLNIDVDKVATIQGTIQAGNYQIFTGSGYTNTVQLPGHNNICWYPGSSLNDKWDAMINQWTSGAWVKRTVYIPRVPIGDSAAINYTGVKYAWKIDGNINIDGKCNNLIVICEGKLFVETASGVTNVVTFSDTDKIEEVFFPLGIQIDCNSEADTGILIKAGSRIMFGGIVHIHDCVNGVVINTDTDSVSEIHIDKVYVGTWTGSAVKLNGNNTAVFSVTINDIYAAVTAGASCRVLEIIGRVPDFVIGHVGGTKNLALGTHEIQYGILIQANTDGAPAYYRASIESGYFNYVGIALKTEDDSGTAALKIRNLDIGPIWASDCTTLMELGYLQECRIDAFDFDDPITVGADCQDVRIIAGKDVAASITDNGVRTRINGVGSETANAETPTAGNWEIGEMVDFIDSGDASGDGVYLKLPDGSWSQIGT